MNGHVIYGRQEQRVGAADGKKKRKRAHMLPKAQDDD